jgi:predicted Zn-dependent protease with MMP-like domain
VHGDPTPTASGRRTPRRASRRDRRGRGLRGQIAPPAVPLARTRSEEFDDLILDAVEELESHWAAELAGIEFAVEEVPPLLNGMTAEFEADVVADRGVPLGRLYREGVPNLPRPMVVVYRRPVEARAGEPEDRGDLVFMVVAELVADLLGRDLDEFEGD